MINSFSPNRIVAQIPVEAFCIKLTDLEAAGNLMHFRLKKINLIKSFMSFSWNVLFQ